jgi:hypothetical protein
MSGKSSPNLQISKTTANSKLATQQINKKRWDSFESSNSYRSRSRNINGLRNKVTTVIKIKDFDKKEERNGHNFEMGQSASSSRNKISNLRIGSTNKSRASNK